MRPRAYLAVHSELALLRLNEAVSRLCMCYFRKAGQVERQMWQSLLFLLLSAHSHAQSHKALCNMGAATVQTPFPPTVLPFCWMLQQQLSAAQSSLFSSPCCRCSGLVVRMHCSGILPGILPVLLPSACLIALCRVPASLVMLCLEVLPASRAIHPFSPSPCMA